MPTCPTCRTQYPEGTASCANDQSELLPDLAFASVENTIEPGTRVGEYEVQGLLGEGAFGAVYRAVHPVIGKAAAIKLLKRELSAKPEMVSRFIAEARAVNQIGHKNIIDVFSFGVHDDGRHYYVMELLGGMTLDQYLRKKGRLAPYEAMPILRQLARALGAAHAAGIAHRDLKPENVFLTFDEGVPIPKLLDFGLAKLVHEGESAHKTKSGIPMGTPLYMSPEQVHGVNVDARTDIYAFGVLAFELLTGRLPFDGGSVMDIMMKQVSARPPTLSSMSADLPAALDVPIHRMLEKDPEKRPRSILDAALELENTMSSIGLLSGSVGGSSAPIPVAAHSSRGHSSASVIDSGAATIAGPPPSELLAAQGRAQPTRWPLFVVLGVGVVGAISVGAVVMRGASQRPTGPASATPIPSLLVSPSATPSASVSISGGPSVTPVDTASAPAMPKTVKLKLHATPSDSEVFIGSTRLGLASDVLELPRGSGSVKLTIKRAGYQPRTLEVNPTDDIVDSVVLSPGPPHKEYTF